MGSVPANVGSATASAASLDGRLFQFRGPLGSAVDPGGFVTLTEPGGRRQIGQVDDVEFAPDDSLTGVGKILGVIVADGRLDVKSSFAFSSAELTPTEADTIDRVFAGAGATLHVGSLIASDGIPARLLPHRFNRHTFWCGQSGSGKTYALGVLIEQLLLHTSLPMVIFDPNADFVRLREPNGDAGAPGSASGTAPSTSSSTDEHRMLAQRDIRILRPGAPAPDALRVRFIDMPLSAKAAVLRLDPLDDRGEYNELMHIEETVGVLDAAQIIPKLLERDTPAAQALAARIENLRLIDWEVWAGEQAAVTDIVDTRPDATILDLGGFGYADESLVVAMALLDDLWAKREQRRPILIVIDEAHNLCSPDAQGTMQRAVRERLIQIAAEGRKFGLWLLLSTQRPSRIHPSIISQCDNLALMKMTSPLDLDELATIFGFVPPAMLARSPRFRQGEALFAGGFVPAPAMIAMGARLTREGGADVGVPIRP